MTSETKRAADERYYKWESAVGAGPYRLIGGISFPSKSLQEHNPAAYSNALAMMTAEARALGVEWGQLGSCEVCGMCLTHNAIWRNAAGRVFVTGWDCAAKADVMTSEAEQARKRSLRAREAAITRAKNKAAADAWAAEMDRLGVDGFVSEEGLIRGTYEQRELRRRERIEAEKAQAAERNGWLIQVLEAQRGGFCQDMARTLAERMLSSHNFSPRQIEILCDIWAKAHGRRGSKANAAAAVEFGQRAEGLTVEVEKYGRSYEWSIEEEDEDQD
jgi:post-segregation antitoxin (ccd killing protein)